MLYRISRICSFAVVIIVISPISSLSQSLYLVTESGFQVELPRNWSQIGHHERELNNYFIYGNNDDKTNIFDVIEWLALTDKDNISWGKESQVLWNLRNGGFLIEEVPKEEIPLQEEVYGIYRWQGEKYWGYVLYLVGNERYFELSITGRKEIYAEHLKSVTSILSSFRIAESEH